MSPRAGRLLLLAILTAAAAARVVSLLDLRAHDPLFPTRETYSDGRYYHEWAVALAQGKEFPPEPSGRPHWMPPLYPWVLSLLYRIAGPHALSLVLLQHALGIAGLLLLHRLARRVFEERAALLAVALGAFFLPPAFLEGKPMAETLAAFLALAGLSCLPGSRPRATAGGFLLGLASCARPQLLPALPAVALALAKGPTRPAVLPFLAGAVLAPGATLVRNFAVSGQPVLVSANGGVNFHLGNHPGVRGTFRAPGPQWGSILEQRETALREASRALGREVGEREASAFFYRRGLGWIASHPAEATVAFAAKASCLLSNEETEIVYSPTAERELAASLHLFFVPFAALLGLATTGLFASARDPAMRRVLLSFLAAGAALQVAFFPYSRFRVLLLPALLPFAGAGCLVLLEAVRSRRRLGPCAAGIAAAALSFLAPAAASGPLRANAFVDIGNAWREEGNLREAERAYGRSLEIHPTARARLTLAELLEGTGRIAQAEAQLRLATEGSALGQEALYRLGVLYLSSQDPAFRRPEESRRIFEDLLREDPANFEARCGLGTCLLARGELERARVEFERAASLSPDRPEAWNGLASALEGLGRLPEARAARARAAKPPPARR
ncbi:MAG: tetratricopeptide repeat protein [Planctomycetes bacterium]|nr:tetratricopeptide repeat protein [Planctomycetota bacterium]